MILQITNQAMMRVFAFLALISIVAGTLPTTASAIVVEQMCINSEENLLTNPSFESPTATAHAEGAGFWETFSSILGGWVSSSGDGFEVWNNMFGGTPFGSQNLELDVNAPTTVSQTIPTVVGNVYKLSYAFAARPGVGASDNSLEVKVAGATAANHSADGTSDTSIVWNTYSTVFTATGATTLIEFADTGTGTAGEGTLLDNTKVCLVADHSKTSVGGQKWNDTNGDGNWDEGEYGQDGVTITITDGEEFSASTVTTDEGYYSFGDLSTGVTYTICEVIPSGAEQTYPFLSEKLSSTLCESNGNGYQVTPSGEGESGFDFGNHEIDTYEIYGFVWDDTNENDAFEPDETDLEGWTVQAKNTETNEVVTDETDASGRYSLNVTVGTWVVSQVVQDGWIQLSNADGDGTYTVVIAAPVEEIYTLAFPLNLLISVAHAANVSSYVGPKNFGNDFVPQSSSGSKSNRSSDSDSNSNGGTTSGGSTPTGQVLGAATTTLPVGAPNTGAGSTSQLPTLPTLSAILTTGVTRRTK